VDFGVAVEVGAAGDYCLATSKPDQPSGHRSIHLETSVRSNQLSQGRVAWISLEIRIDHTTFFEDDMRVGRLPPELISRSCRNGSDLEGGSWGQTFDLAIS
jgi:hypothetical protein